MNDKEIDEDYTLVANSPEELSSELKLLYDLKVIDYRVVGAESFQVGFTKDFTDYTKNNKIKIIEKAKEALFNTMVRDGTEEFDEEISIATWYASAFVSYLRHTAQLSKVADDKKLLGKLVARVQEMNDNFVKITKKEGLDNG